MEVFHEMQDGKLVVIGDGLEYEKIKKERKVHIELLGYQGVDELFNRNIFDQQDVGTIKEAVIY